jgi:hypothetical protein
MSDINVIDALSSLDEDWGVTEAAKGGGLPPDGVYEARIDRFDFVNSKFDGSLQLKTEMEITAGDHGGSRVSIWHDLQDKDRLKYLKGYLETIQIKIEKLSDLQEALGAALDVVVEVRIKTTSKRVDGEQKQYTNVYVNRFISAPPDKPAANNDRVTTADAAGDDLIPF